MEKKCECYDTVGVYKYDASGFYNGVIGICKGTKERDECKCGGDKSKCDFYPAIREEANELIKKVGFYDPVTVVFWNDGTKTVVKAEGESFDKEKGLAMAIAKKHFGNTGSYWNVFKKWIKED